MNEFTALVQPWRERLASGLCGDFTRAAVDGLLGAVLSTGGSLHDVRPTERCDDHPGAGCCTECAAELDANVEDGAAPEDNAETDAGAARGRRGRRGGRRHRRREEVQE